MSKKSSVDKCHLLSVCAEHGGGGGNRQIWASDVYLGCDAGKARTATTAEALAERVVEIGRHPHWVPPEHHKKGGGRAEASQFGR